VKLTTSGPVAEVVDPGTAFRIVGGAGDPTITVDDGCDAALDPTAFRAFTVHVYVFAAVSPAIVIGPDAAEPEPAAPPSLETHDAS
jgi:hypothetical protein